MAASPALSRAEPRAESIIAAALMLALVAAVTLRVVLHGSAPQPDPIPITAAEVWMADALPSVGAKTRAEVAAHIRAGDLEALPARARADAQACFSGWPAR